MKKRKCYFCKARKEHVIVYLRNERSKFYPICFLCNRNGIHLTLEERWQKKTIFNEIYDYLADKFILGDIEYGRLMRSYLQEL